MRKKESFFSIRELHFGLYRRGNIVVAINLKKSYDKSLDMANQLYQELVDTLTFDYNIVDPAHIVIVGSGLRKEMLCLGMGIFPVTISQSEATSLLKEAGFLEGLLVP